MTPDSHRFVPPAPINLTFLIQTENLARSVVASLGEFATRVSGSGGRLRVVTLDPIMHQGVREILQDLTVCVEDAPAASSTPFYLLSRPDQLRFLISARAPLSRFLRGTDVLVIDADGAVQRMMRRSIRPDGRVILSIDALLYHFDRGRHSWWRRGLVRLSEAVGLDPYVPSATATSALDGILVPHPTVADTVRSAGARAPIQRVIFPRIEAALLESDGEALPDWRGGLRLLYATGSYRWHRHAEWDAMQRQELLDLCELAESNPDLSIRIRRHPREREAEYRRLVLPDNVTLSGPEIPSLTDLRGCHALLTSRSSMALEAALLGKPSFVSTRRFPPPAPTEFARTCPNVTVVDDFGEVIRLFPTANDRALIGEGRRFVDAVLDPLQVPAPT